MFGFDSAELRPGGSQEALTAHNADDYVERSLDFVLDRGLRRQLESLRAGFCQVFPLEKLSSFNPDEVRTMLCGDQCPVFTREEVLRYTEPKLGYSRDSPGFLRLVNVLVGFSAAERKAFLQFTTGCSSLPPGKYREHFAASTNPQYLTLCARSSQAAWRTCTPG